MEKVKELIDKYVSEKKSRKNFISNVKNYFRKKGFEYDELQEIISYLKILSNNLLIDKFIMLYIEEHIVDMNFDNIVELLKQLDVKLSRGLIIQLIFKNIIDKDNKDKIAKYYNDVTELYYVIRGGYQVDYDKLLKDSANVDILRNNSLRILDKYEELKCLIDYKINKNKKALNCLIMYNGGLIHDKLVEFRNILPIKDENYGYFFNSGLIGLYKAIINFDIYSGYKLSTYANRYIRLEISRDYAKDRLISLPIDMLESSQKRKRYSKIDSLINTSESIISLDETIGNSSDSEELYNIMTNDNIYNNINVDVVSEEDKVLRNTTNDYIIDELKKVLTTKQFNVIYRYYYNGLTDNEIAKMSNVSYSNVNNMRKAAIEKLKNNTILKNLLLDIYDINEEVNMVEVIEDKKSKETYTEPRIDNFDEYAIRRASLISKFCGLYQIAYKANYDDIEETVIMEYNTEHFNRYVYNKIGRKSFKPTLINGYPFITIKDIDTELRNKKKKITELDSPMHIYMEIDDIFYLKIANKIREENGKSVDTLSILTSNINANIYSQTRFVANHYYGRPATTEEVENLLEIVFLTYYGDVPMTTHIKNVIQKEINRQLDNKIEPEKTKRL